MAAVGIGFLFVLFAVVAPLALYWFVREEDPDPSQTTSWDEATEKATRDRFGGGRTADDRDDRPGSDRDRRRSDDRPGSDRDDLGRRTRDDRDDDGNHWG